MRQIRFAAIAFVSLVAAIASSFIDPGTFFHRTLSFSLCSVLGLTSNLCYANLARNSGERAVAAIPPIEQTQNTVPTLDFSPYFQSTRPEFEGSDVPAKPETSNPPSNSSPPQPSPSTPINTPSPNNPSPQPSRLVPGSSGTSNEPCNPTLLTASAQPAKEVIVKGVPSSFTELEAGVKADGMQDFFPTALRRLENGDVSLFVPLHPTNTKAGGDVQLAIASGDSICSALSLRIEPLVSPPGSAGSTKRTAEKAEAFVNKLIEGSGISRAELMGDPKSLSQEALPLSLVQWLLDHPQNPNSLKAILDGTAPILKGQKIDYELLDSLVANSGLNSAMDNVINTITKKLEIRNAAINQLYWAGTKTLHKDYASASLTAQKPVRETSEPYYISRLGSSLFNFLDCLPSKVSNADQLNDCIWGQKAWEDTQKSGEYQALVYAVKGIIFVIGSLFAPVGIGGAILLGSSLGVTLVDILLQFNVALMPSKLTKLEFVATPSTISKEESGTWDKVTLEAESERFKLTLDLVLDLILSAIGLNKFTLRSTELAFSSALFGVRRSKKFIELAEAVSGLKGAVEPWFKLAGLPLGDSPGVGVGEPLKYKVEAKKQTTPVTGSSGIISLNVASNTYQGVNPGEATLSLSVRDELFAGKKAPNYLQTITVKDKDDDKPQPQPQDGGGATSWGDPHLVTFDRLKYDHQAVGEFILAKSTDGTFEIQVREASVPASSQVALNTAAAMKVGNTRVAFYVKDFPDSDTTNPLRVDGKPTVIQGGSLSLPGGGSISQVNQGSYIVEWSTGERVGVKVDNFGSSALLDINPALPQTRQGQLIGLLGNFNGNPDDDLKSRDGKVLPPQSTINQVSQITQNLTNWVPIPLNQVESLFLEQLHKQFGDSWRISQQESLFDYAPGKNTESFTNRAFPNGFQVLRMLLPAQVQAAEAACRQAGVPSERLEGCLFDVGVTGNADFAKVAANALTNIVRDRIQNEIQQRIPVPVKIPGLPF